MRCPNFIQDGGGSGETCNAIVRKLYTWDSTMKNCVGYWCKRCGFQEIKHVEDYSAISKKERERMYAAEAAECS